MEKGRCTCAQRHRSPNERKIKAEGSKETSARAEGVWRQAEGWLCGKCQKGNQWEMRAGRDAENVAEPVNYPDGAGRGGAGHIAA